MTGHAPSTGDVRAEGTRPPLTIALPKGRTLAPVFDLFAQVGVSALGPDGGSERLAVEKDSRALVKHAKLGSHRLALLFLKPDDVPTYVEYGTADLGICGRDVLFEREADVYHPVDLELGKCRLVVAGKKTDLAAHARSESARMPRVATKYPRSAAWHFARRGLQVEIVNVQGSVELAPVTGLADLIVDLVETGTTLAQNGLEVKDEILTVSSLLIANRASYKLKAEPISELVGALRSIITNAKTSA